jgi:hypothetical protein
MTMPLSPARSANIWVKKTTLSSAYTREKKNYFYHSMSNRITSSGRQAEEGEKESSGRVCALHCSVRS